MQHISLTDMCIINGKGYVKVKVKTIYITGRRGIWACQMLWIPHFIDNQLTGGSKYVSLTRRPLSTLAP
jgi:hypothetical protein